MSRPLRLRPPSEPVGGRKHFWYCDIHKQQHQLQPGDEFNERWPCGCAKVGCSGKTWAEKAGGGAA